MPDSTGPPLRPTSRRCPAGAGDRRPRRRRRPPARSPACGGARTDSARAAGFFTPACAASAPTASTTSARPGRICARAASTACAPDAHAAYTLATRPPCRPNCPGERRTHHMPRTVSAPTTEPTPPPLQPGVGGRRAGRRHPVLDEAAPPLAPGVHARAEHRHLAHSPPTQPGLRRWTSARGKKTEEQSAQRTPKTRKPSPSPANRPATRGVCVRVTIPPAARRDGASESVTADRRWAEAET